MKIISQLGNTETNGSIVTMTNSVKYQLYTTEIPFDPPTQGIGT